MSEIWDSDDIDSVGHDDCISVNDHDSALKEIQKEIAALQAENAEQREALQSIKARVCGEMTNGWKDQWDTTNSRGAIADICDKALTRPSEVQ
jgi:hypothetical protein